MPTRPHQNCREHGCPERTDHASGYCPAHQKSNSYVEHERERNRIREQSPHRHLYNLAAWKRLRIRKLGRDPMCQGIVFGEPCRNPATVIHHKEDHKGNVKLFFDMSNLVSLCKPCHDAIRESEGKINVR